MIRKGHHQKSNDTDSFDSAFIRECLLYDNPSSTYGDFNVICSESYELYSIQSGTNSEQYCHILPINKLDNRCLKKPIMICYEHDEDNYIARCLDFPVKSYGDNVIDAIDNLKTNIEELIDDLLVDDNFSKYWLKIKKKIITIL